MVKADFVAVSCHPGGKVWFAPWAEVERLAGDLLEPIDDYWPPRVITRAAFPEDLESELAAVSRDFGTVGPEPH